MAREIQQHHRNQACPECGSRDVIVACSVFMRLTEEDEIAAKGYEVYLSEEPTSLFQCESCKHQWDLA